jgi:hypothetical protein
MEKPVAPPYNTRWARAPIQEQVLDAPDNRMPGQRSVDSLDLVLPGIVGLDRQPGETGERGGFQETLSGISFSTQFGP